MRRAVVLLVALAAACGGAPPTLPACGDGDGLTTDAEGQLRCQPLTSALQLPSCEGAADALTSDGTSLGCTGRVEDYALITDALRGLSEILDRVDRAVDGLKPPRAQARYVGATTMTTTGNMLRAGDDNSLVSAVKMCSAQYGAGAHMCTVYELYASVASGVLHTGSMAPRAWLWFPGWNRPVATAMDPELGVADTCGSHTYQSAALGWVGMTAEWGPLPSGTEGLVLRGGLQSSCRNNLPISCCL